MTHVLVALQSLTWLVPVVHWDLSYFQVYRGKPLLLVVVGIRLHLA